MFCPSCGSAIKDEAKFCSHCGAVIAAAKPNMQPEPEAKPKRRVRWPLFVLPVLILALAAAGLFYWRTTRTPSQIRFYDADGELYSVDKFDSHGRYLSNVGYENGEKTYIEEYRITDACDQIDTSDVEEMDGVKEVECRECFIRESGEDDFEPEDVFVVIGYDRHGKLAGGQTYVIIEDEIHLLQTWEVELDRFGNPIEETYSAANGDTRLHETLDNHYSFGLIGSAEMHWKGYGSYRYDAENNTIYVEPFDEPTVETRSVEYWY